MMPERPYEPTSILRPFIMESELERLPSVVPKFKMHTTDYKRSINISYNFTTAANKVITNPYIHPNTGLQASKSAEKIYVYVQLGRNRSPPYPN